MMVIPAIDLIAGRVVRLQQGDFSRETRYVTDPLELAERYQQAGAGLLHIVDLDAARAGGNANLGIIRRICNNLSIPVQTGGGVRSRSDLEARLEAGAARVIIGSLCVRQPGHVGRWLEEFGSDRVVAGLDVQRGPDGDWMPCSAGWTERGTHALDELLEVLAGWELAHLLCTDIERDGMFSGLNLDLYRGILERFPALQVQASGGVGREAHLAEAADTGVAGCIVGRALLEGRITPDAIGRYSGNGAAGRGQ